MLGQAGVFSNTPPAPVGPEHLADSGPSAGTNPPTPSDFPAGAPLPPHQRAAAARAGLPAWLLSCTLHLFAALTVGLLLQVPTRGVAPAEERQAGIVLVRRNASQTSYLSEDEAESEGASASAADVSSTSSAALAAALPSPDRPPVDLAGALPEASDVAATLAGESLPAAGDFAAGGRSRGNARDWGDYATRTSVFGIEGKGSRFVYVFDRSGSMEGFEGRPLAAAKAELLTSLQDLRSTHQFQIIFYNERPFPFNPHHPQPPRMLFGDEQNKRLAERFVRGVVGDGGTRHMEALKMALGMGPDVVFFLTDAAEPALSRRQLDDIRRLNGRVGASIHAIEFGVGAYRGGSNFLVQLARENRGQHTYVDLTRLTSRP